MCEHAYKNEILGKGAKVSSWGIVKEESGGMCEICLMSNDKQVFIETGYWTWD